MYRDRTPGRRTATSASSSSVPSSKRNSNKIIQFDNQPRFAVDCDQQLAKKFRTDLTIADNRNNFKLKNITNTVELKPAVTDAAGVVDQTRKKLRKTRPKKDDTGTKTDPRAAKCAKVSGEKVEVIVEGQEKLRHVLGKHYFDVGKRVNLDHTPSCLKNIVLCKELHANRLNQARRVNRRIQQDTRELLIENRPVHFLNYLEQALMRNEVIDSQLFVKALELALTINQPSDQLKADYTAQSLLDKIVDVLDRTVDQFPPCWLDLKQAYHGIIFGTLEEDCFAKYGHRDGLFKLVIFLLEQCVESEKSRNTSAHLSKSVASKERSMANYYLWEQENNQKYDYDLLERDDKLERLFLVLQILVKILESDLTMWILRHPHNAKENMIHPNRKPLIASVLWYEHSTVGEVNSIIKRILALYVNVTAVRYPADNIQTLSRLLSITGTAINLTEIQYDGTIEYPCIKDNTRYFAQQIWNQLYFSSYYGVSLCFRAIEQMRSPLIRMILANEFLKRLAYEQMDAPSVSLYLKYLSSGVWKEYPESNHSDAVSTGDRFPLLNKTKSRKAAHDIDQAQYLKLLLIAFQAYMEVYALKTYYQDLKSRQDDVDLRAPSRSTRKSINTKKKVDLDGMEKTIKTMSEKFSRSVKPVVRHAADRSVPLVLEEISVPSTLLLRYRDDVKHLLLIYRWIQTKGRATEEYRLLFEPWRSYLASIDETLRLE